MGVFRDQKWYAAPTKEQRERYMKGESEECISVLGERLCSFDPEAAYLKDDIDDIRILFTGFKDKREGAG